MQLARRVCVAGWGDFSTTSTSCFWIAVINQDLASADYGNAMRI
jgi:hypothetical protein